MYTLSVIKSAFEGKCGFRDSLDPDFSSLDTAETGSTTGQYYNDIHPLISQENLDAIAPNYDAYNVTAWSALTTYAVGEMVENDNVTYISKTAANLNHEPPNDTYWKTGLSVFLNQLEQQSMVTMIDTLLRDKNIEGSSKSMYANLMLFDGVGKNSDTITQEGRFVFLEVKLFDYDNLRMVLNRIGLQTTLAQTGLTIYIYHSSRLAALATISYTSDKTYTMEWADAGVNLDYFPYSATNAARERDAGGYFYIGYYEDDLKGQAINRNFDLTDVPNCGGCPSGTYNRLLFERRSDYLNVRAGSVAAAHLNGGSMWDVQYNEYDRNMTWGLNLGFSIECELTQFLVDHVDQLRDLLMKQVGYDCLQKMAYTTRTNRLSDQTKADAMFALNGEGDNWSKKLEKAYKEANLNTSNLSTPCLSRKKTGVSYGSI